MWTPVAGLHVTCGGACEGDLHSQRSTIMSRQNSAAIQPPPPASGHWARGLTDDRAASRGGIRLAELLGRLSLGFDIANQTPYGGAVRSVVLAVELGKRAGATKEELHETFWLALLGYLGRTGLAHDEDDLASNSDLSRRDTAIQLAEIVGAGPRALSLLDPIGEPNQAAALPRQLTWMARLVEATHKRKGREAAAAIVVRTVVAPLEARLATTFAAEQAELFAAIEDPRIFDRFLDLEPLPVAWADEHRVDEVARALAIFADLQCPIFVGHSTAVAALAEQAAAALGFGAVDIRVLRRAALLHDIGRVGVPNDIWCRPGPLDWGEMERVRLHAYYTRRVLSPIEVLGPVAEIAASGHERVDGGGYSQGRIARSLPPAARLLAVVDMAVAMGEPRPYRPALDREVIASEIGAEVAAGHLDPQAADAVLATLGVKDRIALRKAPSLSERELEVCRLIAHGKMNKEIADVLGISLRTVQNHVAHIFDKLGMHSRSGVAVWLVENDFLQ
jgi:HD-GYP domain-containing protein (c-di-GMP phosphodiesterase class II)